MVEIDELATPTVCSSCGAPLDGQEDRAYYFGESGALCWRCAIDRGGVYDADQERWAERPDVSDLLEAFQ